MPTTQLLPYAYAITLGLVSQQVVPANPGRKGVIFFNASAANTIYVFPAFLANGAALPASIGGAGGIAVVPGGLLSLPQPGMEILGAVANAAFNAIATNVNTALTVWEF